MKKTVFVGYYLFNGQDDTCSLQGASLGLKCTKEFVTAGGKIENVVCAESELISTGWASNSYNVFIMAEEEKVANEELVALIKTFENIVEKSYGEPFDSIDFDDESFEEERKEWEKSFAEKGKVTKLGEKLYKIELR